MFVDPIEAYLQPCFALAWKSIFESSCFTQSDRVQLHLGLFQNIHTQNYMGSSA